MDPFQEIEQRLTKYPELKYDRQADSISVYPKDESGFAVAMHQDKMNDEFIIHFGAMAHIHFDNAGEALRCFAWALSPECRLVTTFRGTFPVRAQVESRNEDGWSLVELTSLVFIPFWCRKSVVIQQNNAIN